MAIVSLLAGGLVGFFSAIVSLIMLNASLLMALGIWSGIGALVAGCILMIAFSPKKMTEKRRLTHNARIFPS